VEGQPSARDMLMPTAMQIMFPAALGTPKRPKQLLLAYRCVHFSSSLGVAMQHILIGCQEYPRAVGRNWFLLTVAVAVDERHSLQSFCLCVPQ
jgi:hypothetical protein